MINLLPPELKKEYRYARHNSRLLHWVIIFAIGLIGAGLLTAGGVYYLHRTTKSYANQVSSTETQLKAQKLTEIQGQVTEISNNLQLVVRVLSKEILFSQLLNQLGIVTPSNTILTNLAISQTQGAIDITAQTTDYAAATQLQANLADPNNKIFTKTDLVSINCANTAPNTQYPCTVTLRALFAANNPFLFISNSTTKKATP